MLNQKKKKKKCTQSCRTTTKNYFLSIGQNQVLVCKVIFLNTLGVSEMVTRTALIKVFSTGTLEEEKRGEMQSDAAVERNRAILTDVNEHIHRYPRVEFHFYRSSTTREYLHPDLTRRKMYQLFLIEWIPRVMLFLLQKITQRKE